MSNQKFVIKEGIKGHCLNTDAYKTDFVCVFLTVPLLREYVTKNALVPFLLKRGTEKYPTQYLLNKEFDDMYGATFNCGIDKMSDNVVLKFCIETINNDYALDGEDILKNAIEILMEIVFNPVKKDGLLNVDFLDIEKNNLRNLIESKIDDKDSYAYEKCISSMYGENNFGLFKYGYIEDLDSIDINTITEYYNWLIDNAKIDIFVSGNNTKEHIENVLKENVNIQKLNARPGNYIIDSYLTNEPVKKEEKYVEEKMNVTQGKLVLGLDVLDYSIDNIHAIGIVYNSILGDGANSMLFQNVREKASLAYSTKSIFVKQKMNVFIRCGIQIENYDKAIGLIKEQVENIKNGLFSDEDVENAKTYLISYIKNIEEEQDTEIVYYFGQEISKKDLSIAQYIENISRVSKEDVVNFAKSINLNTVYFLRN